jgi:hypothetical protein
MFRSIALSLAVVFALAANASADVFIGTGVIQTNNMGGTAGNIMTNGGVNQIIGNTTLGVQYINNVSTNVFPNLGGTIHSIGSNLIATYGFRNGGGIPASFNGQDVVAVFAAQGTATPSGATAQFFLNQVGVALYAVPTGSYNQNDPTTWSSGTLIATFGNAFNANVIDQGPAAFFGGGPGFVNLAAAQTNVIGANSVVGASNQGFFLFEELTNQNFWDIIGNAGLLPNNNPNAIVTRVDESYQVGDSINTAGLTAAGLTALNNLYNTLLPGVSMFGFATGIGALGDSGGLATDFNPSSGNPAPNTADVLFTFGTTTVLGNQLQIQDIPEPTTLAVFAGLVGVGGLVYRKRRGVNTSA